MEAPMWGKSLGRGSLLRGHDGDQSQRLTLERAPELPFKRCVWPQAEWRAGGTGPGFPAVAGHRRPWWEIPEVA